MARGWRRGCRTRATWSPENGAFVRRPEEGGEREHDHRRVRNPPPRVARRLEREAPEGQAEEDASDVPADRGPGPVHEHLPSQDAVDHDEEEGRTERRQEEQASRPPGDALELKGDEVPGPPDRGAQSGEPGSWRRPGQVGPPRARPTRVPEPPSRTSGLLAAVRSRPAVCGERGPLGGGRGRQIGHAAAPICYAARSPEASDSKRSRRPVPPRPLCAGLHSLTSVSCSLRSGPHTRPPPGGTRSRASRRILRDARLLRG